MTLCCFNLEIKKLIICMVPAPFALDKAQSTDHLYVPLYVT